MSCHISTPLFDTITLTVFWSHKNELSEFYKTANITLTISWVRTPLLTRALRFPTISSQCTKPNCSCVFSVAEITMDASRMAFRAVLQERDGGHLESLAYLSFKLFHTRPKTFGRKYNVILNILYVQQIINHWRVYKISDRHNTKSNRKGTCSNPLRIFDTSKASQHGIRYPDPSFWRLGGCSTICLTVFVWDIIGGLA